MKLFVVIIVAIIGLILGVGVGLNITSKPIEIKFRITFMDWLGAELCTFFLFFVAFVVEYYLSEYLLAMVGSDSWLEKIFHSAIENGIFVPVLCALISLIFYFIMRADHLEYADMYSVKVPKIFFSMLIIATCVRFVVMWKDGNFGDEDEKYMLSRLTMWIVMVIGTWFGLGFGCKERDKGGCLVPSAEKKRISLREWLQRPIVIEWIKALSPISVLCIIILALPEIIMKNPYFSGGTIFLGASFIIGLFIYTFVWVRNNRPGTKRSNMILSKAINKSKDSNVANKKYHYGMMQYSFVGKNIVVDPIDIYYPECDNSAEFNDLFGIKVLSFSSENDIGREFEERARRQKEYIKKGFANSLEIFKNGNRIGKSDIETTGKQDRESNLKHKINCVRSCVANRYRKLKKYFSLPQVCISFLILLLVIVTMILAIVIKNVNPFWSSIFANIFSGLITGLVISLIASAKAVYTYKTECKIEWLVFLNKEIIEFNKAYRKFMADKKNMQYEDAYEIICMAQDINCMIESTKKPIDMYRYFSKSFSYDARKKTKICDEMIDAIQILDGCSSLPLDSVAQFRRIYKDLWALRMEVIKNINDLREGSNASKSSIL